MVQSVYPYRGWLRAQLTAGQVDCSLAPGWSPGWVGGGRGLAVGQVDCSLISQKVVLRSRALGGE